VTTHYEGPAAEVRALDAYVKLVRCAAAVGQRLEARLRALGLTENQLGVLEMLLHLGPQVQGAIGAKLFTSRPNVSLILGQLEERGLVRRERSVEDRRRGLVELTPEGRRYILRIFPGHVAAIVEELSVLGPRDQELLARLCKAVGRREQLRGAKGG
jgi:MarR family 2-MHQ and catechol resistance regulon transcriptional repressor